MHWSAGVVGGALTGTGVLWEPEGRRQELAIYVLPQTLIVIWNKLKQYATILSLSPPLSSNWGSFLFFC